MYLEHGPTSQAAERPLTVLPFSHTALPVAAAAEDVASTISVVVVVTGTVSIRLAVEVKATYEVIVVVTADLVEICTLGAKEHT